MFSIRERALSAGSSRPELISQPNTFCLCIVIRLVLAATVPRGYAILHRRFSATGLFILQHPSSKPHCHIVDGGLIDESSLAAGGPWSHRCRFARHEGMHVLIAAVITATHFIASAGNDFIFHSAPEDLSGALSGRRMFQRSRGGRSLLIGAHRRRSR